MMKPEYLFYDGPYDALEKSIAYSGKTKKSIASSLYPGRQSETAKSLLSRAMSPENTDVRLSIENMLVLMKETRPDDLLYFLCDYFGFERPKRKTTDRIKQDIAAEVREMNHKLAALLRQLPELEDDEESK
ncbi:MAG: hypothetical protein ABFD75_12435 [Smithella sp.]